MGSAMATTYDALVTRLLDALRGVWRNGRDAQTERELAIETLRQIAALGASSHDLAERLHQTVQDLQRLPSNQEERRQHVEQIASRVKAIQPHLGVGNERVEIGKLNSALDGRRASRTESPTKSDRPAIVSPLPPDAAVTTLAKVGPKVETLLDTLINGPANAGEKRDVTIEQVLRIQPRRYVDYSNLVKIGSPLVFDGDVTVEGEIVDIREQYGGRPHVTARISDGTGSLTLIWFNTYISKQLKEGDRIYVSGTIRRGGYSGSLEMTAPEWERANGPGLTTGRLAPVYPLTKGLYQKNMRTITRNALDVTKNRLVDWLADAKPFLDQRLQLAPIDLAYEYLHFPESMEQVAIAKRRLQFENLFLLQLGLVHRKQHALSSPAQPFTVDGAAVNAFKKSLPFRLTGAQERVAREIIADIRRPTPMTRLLQGDVGSGKTAVAAIIALIARDNGKQTAFMAPTELLAEQHERSLERLYAGLDEAARPRIALLTGSTRVKRRREIDAALSAGEIDILVGTHAMVQEAVTFRDLALVIVDEQHRFGVRHRAMLAEKANGMQPHVLSMTATPIPRTLNLVLSGDLDVSTMDELPPGRVPIETALYRPAQRNEAYRLVREQVARGHQVFVVCPLVEESEAIDARAAVEEAQRLQQDVFPNLRVDVVHGRMGAKKKDATMTAFRDHEFDILVSTSVIEVGIDIPNATVMMIEGAERFGLAQLHQFRGRVGRGAARSYCLLLADTASADGEGRLQTMVATNDGFVLAQKDLELRGPGDFIGTRQSGLPELGWLNDGFDSRLLEAARAAGERLIEADPEIEIRRFPRLKPRLQQYWATASAIDTSKA
ncbi:ATP-dependent DNA helicase RecG [soil metagenome]